MSEISSEIRKHKGMYYTYGLYRPCGKIFYVGVGIRDRVLVHGRTSDMDTHAKSLRVRVIRKIIDSGQEVGRKILKFHHNRQAALRHEIELIRYFGRVVDKTGILCNITSGGDGSTGVSPNKETRLKMSLSGRNKDMTNVLFKSNQACKKPVLCLNNMTVFDCTKTLIKWLNFNNVSIHINTLQDKIKDSILTNGLLFTYIDKSFLPCAITEGQVENIKFSQIVDDNMGYVICHETGNISTFDSVINECKSPMKKARKARGLREHLSGVQETWMGYTWGRVTNATTFQSRYESATRS